MTPPRSSIEDREHFRFDGEFVKLIERQSEQKIMLNNLNEKIESIKESNSANFDKLGNKLEELGKSIGSIQNNCLAHKILEANNERIEANNNRIEAKNNTIEAENAALKKANSNYVLQFNPTIIKAIIVIIASLIAYFYGVEPKLP